jgi:Protein of unknown function (DUF2695)
MVDASRKKELTRAAREADRSAFRGGMPLDPESARALFDAVDAALRDHRCEHDHRLTIDAVRKTKLAPEIVIPWLTANGGGCDCEVIANVEPKVEEAFEWDR